ncbi:NDR1/HIN1-like protein 3 [Andrographis paniculata]|uniref:NDR1/HIN1-like protein 3 n=1 Tax=Andrographis paniculata TaxID=175694 RepID=UPI0021E7675B|nr:NDR1/HIN1-like protein 3 [Andrographis paniculata]
MGETRQPHLNGAYYGPSIPPPPRKSYHRPGRGGGGGCCCNPFSCCCSCLMNCICTCVFQILCTILVILGVVVFVLWLIFRPNAVKFYATNASLTEFSLEGNNTLRYNLALNLTIRNPNKRIGIYYDRIEAEALYEGQRFGWDNLQTFYQGHKSTNNLTAEFSGTHVVPLGAKEMSNYNGDRTSGVYDIDVKLKLRVRLKFWIVKSARWKPKIECDLKIPLTSNGTAPQAFESKRCDFDWR